MFCHALLHVDGVCGNPLKDGDVKVRAALPGVCERHKPGAASRLRRTNPERGSGSLNRQPRVDKPLNLRGLAKRRDLFAVVILAKGDSLSFALAALERRVVSVVNLRVLTERNAKGGKAAIARDADPCAVAVAPKRDRVDKALSLDALRDFRDRFGRNVRARIPRRGNDVFQCDLHDA